jgi:hypothetical protein
MISGSESCWKSGRGGLSRGYESVRLLISVSLGREEETAMEIEGARNKRDPKTQHPRKDRLKWNPPRRIENTSTLSCNIALENKDNANRLIVLKSHHKNRTEDK